MSVGKRVAYIKGLAKGLDIDTSTKEGKLLNEIIDVLEDMALEIEEIQEDIVTLDDELCQVNDDLELLEDVFYEDFEDDDDMDRIDDDDEEPVFYEVVCPSCDNEITIDEDVLNLGAIDCPNCGEKLEFDFDSIDDEGCDCGHDHHHH